MNYLWKQQRQRGFTLVEVLTVVAIIGIMAGIVLPNLSGAREKARDDKRLSDLAQLQLTLKLYQQNEGSYPKPSGNGGFVNRADLETLLSPYIDVPTDPRDDGSTTSYYYGYDSNSRCLDLNGDGNFNSQDNGQTILFAKTMERSNNQNWSEVCDCTANCGVSAGAPFNGHVILLSR